MGGQKFCPVLLCSSASNHLPTYPSDFPGHTHESGCKIVNIAQAISAEVVFPAVAIQLKTLQCNALYSDEHFSRFVWILLDLGLSYILWNLPITEIWDSLIFCGMFWDSLEFYDSFDLSSSEFYRILWNCMAGIRWNSMGMLLAFFTPFCFISMNIKQSNQCSQIVSHNTLIVFHLNYFSKCIILNSLENS